MSSLIKSKQDLVKDKYSKLGIKDLAEEFGMLTSPVEEWLNKFITNDEDLNKTKDLIRILARKDNYTTNVLIIGETGTGKELLANALHGSRIGKFVAVNCGGIPDTLLESEFFGSIPGAFTGARERQGYLEEATNGTLFLDEIGEMPPLIQSKLLRVLQERKARRIGSTQEYEVNCRFVSATNRPTQWLLGSNHFRHDLYYRLAGYTLTTKPLIHRREDIKLIIRDYFIANKGGQVMEDRFIDEFDKMPDSVKLLPGNVRQLLNMLNAWRIFNQ